MAKIEAEAKWNGRELEIANVDFFIEQVKDKYPAVVVDEKHPDGVWFDIAITPRRKFRTLVQHGYFFGEVLAKAVVGYNQLGIRVKDKYMAMAKLFLEEDIDCTHRVIDEFTGNVIVRYPKRISELDRLEFSEVMSECILFIESNLGCIVDNPDEYKKRRREKLSNNSNTIQ